MLPSDIWTHVASFLSVKDAARLSGQETDHFIGLARSCCCQVPVPIEVLRHSSVRTAECLHLLQESAGMHQGFSWNMHTSSL